MDPLTGGLIRLAAMGIGKLLDSTESRNSYEPSEDSRTQAQIKEQRKAEEREAAEWEAHWKRVRRHKINRIIVSISIVVFLIIAVIVLTKRAYPE